MKQNNLLKSLGIHTDINLKNITRIGNDRVKDGWWVRIARDGKKISETFSDEDYNNNPYLSLKEAIRLRDNIDPKQVMSNTGYHHISISKYDDGRHPFVRANFIRGEEKSFNIASYGYCFALKEAMRWLHDKDEKLYKETIKLETSKGLTYLNKNIDFDKYCKILEKTLLDLQNGGGVYSPQNKKKTLLIISDKKSKVISKNKDFTYNDYVKNTLKFLRRNKFNFQIENDDFEYNEKDYYAVVKVGHNTSSKEFCFRVRKLIDHSKENYVIQKTAPFFKTIYTDEPNIKKSTIDKIPNLQTKSEVKEYLLEQRELKIAYKKELIRKKNSNLDNVEYAKRKDKQIGYITKEITDYEKLLNWLKKVKN